ncbi:hypothetical protein WISP_135147 [Willisornis vidua]|uniref:Uncharacterized protein n=1 Tax=Willisornis vidua TaxID=1566151 RepID=A0ABQ9CRE4_9PASS|nr:hypothetical protein WISP_135147 [Willisornis vidua]
MVTAPLPGQPTLMSNHPFCEEFLPNVQPKLPMVQLKTTSSHPVAGCLGEEANSQLATAPGHGVVESDKVPLEPPLLQCKQFQLPQALLTGLVLQTLHQLWCPSLESLQHLNVLPELRSPELVTGLEVPHQLPSTGEKIAMRHNPLNSETPFPLVISSDDMSTLQINMQSENIRF